MKQWRGMLPDAFYDVEADTEEEAMRKIIEIAKGELERGERHPIVWEEASRDAARDGTQEKT